MFSASCPACGNREDNPNQLKSNAMYTSLKNAKTSRTQGPLLKTYRLMAILRCVYYEANHPFISISYLP
jgi:hypothetical protein